MFRNFLIVSLLMCGTVSADLILTVGTSNPYWVGTNNATVDVFARSTSGNILISGFDLKFDISPSGVGLPAGITKSVGFVTNPIFNYVAPAQGISGTVSDLQGSIQGNELLDFYINGNSGDDGAGAIQSKTINSTNTPLFTFNFNIANNTSPGSYAISLVNSPAFAVYDATPNFDEIPIQQLVSGSLNVSAIPEPNSITMLFIAMIGLASRRRKRLASKRFSIRLFN